MNPKQVYLLECNGVTMLYSEDELSKAVAMLYKLRAAGNSARLLVEIDHTALN